MQGLFTRWPDGFEPDQDRNHAKHDPRKSDEKKSHGLGIRHPISGDDEAGTPDENKDRGKPKCGFHMTSLNRVKILQ